MEKFSAKKVFGDIRNFLAGRFIGATRDEFLLEEVIKLIFCKYEIGQECTFKLDELELSSLYRKKFKKVLVNHRDIYLDQATEIELDPVSIKYVDEKLQSLDIHNLERDIIGDAYEIFMGDTIKGQSGQFFTPQNAAEALVRMIAPSQDAKILDLACGAGGFLVATLKYWNEKGLPIVRANLHGIDKDNFLTRLAKIHLACMGQETYNIKCADSLVWDEEILGSGKGEYDIILTNPPFGVNIQAGTVETLEKYHLAYKYKRNKSGCLEKTQIINESVAPQVVFLEQCINLVKENGYIGIVVPESMISNKKYSYVVQVLYERCVIKAVIGMPDDLFKTSGKSGTHTKTCLLVLQKMKNPVIAPYNIFMAEAKWCGHDSRGREIPNDDIPQIVRNYCRYQECELCDMDNLGFIINNTEIINNVLAPRAYVYLTQEKNQCFEDTHILVTIGQLIEEGVLTVTTGNEVGKLAYGGGNVPFVRTSDISNWEIKSDPKHLVSEEIYKNLAEKQDVQEGDILMVKDGSYLIGTCAMITKYDTRMVYQSHLYKIRVNAENQYGLDKYFLLASLSSDFFRQQVLSKTFSQDIINSLGDRLKEIIIPISKEPKKIKEISDMVKKSINWSMEAKKMARKARNEVIS